MDTKKMKKDLLSGNCKASVELPIDYWGIILSLLDNCCLSSMENMKDVPNRYIQMLRQEDLTQITGPLLARALIVDKLVEEGFLKEEMLEKAGLPWIAKGIMKQDIEGLN